MKRAIAAKEHDENLDLSVEESLSVVILFPFVDVF